MGGMTACPNVFILLSGFEHVFNEATSYYYQWLGGLMIRASDLWSFNRLPAMTPPSHALPGWYLYISAFRPSSVGKLSIEHIIRSLSRNVNI